VEAKIKLITNRIAELHDLLQQGKGDPRWIRSMLEINEKILGKLYGGEDIIFYPPTKTIEVPRDFFLTPSQVIEPFLNMLN